MSSAPTPSDQPEVRAPERKKKPAWWRRVGAAVLALGALAGAVTAVLVLRPGSDPAAKVTISSVEVVSQPLSTFAATATIRPLGGGNLINPFGALPDLRSTETSEATAAPPSRATTHQ